MIAVKKIGFLPLCFALAMGAFLTACTDNSSATGSGGGSTVSEFPTEGAYDPTKINPQMPADGLAAWSTTEVEVEEVASWDLMVKHGEYHATNMGKVYSYGDSHDYNLWLEARESFHKAGDDISDALADIRFGKKDQETDLEK